MPSPDDKNVAPSPILEEMFGKRPSTLPFTIPDRRRREDRIVKPSAVEERETKPALVVTK